MCFENRSSNKRTGTICVRGVGFVFALMLAAACSDALPITAPNEEISRALEKIQVQSGELRTVQAKVTEEVEVSRQQLAEAREILAKVQAMLNECRQTVSRIPKPRRCPVCPKVAPTPVPEPTPAVPTPNPDEPRFSPSDAPM